MKRHKTYKSCPVRPVWDDLELCVMYNSAIHRRKHTKLIGHIATHKTYKSRPVRPAWRDLELCVMHNSALRRRKRTKFTEHIEPCKTYMSRPVRPVWGDLDLDLGSNQVTKLRNIYTYITKHITTKIHDKTAREVVDNRQGGS